MTNAELHEILDNKNKKISLKEYRDILWQLKEDCFNEINVKKVSNPQFYYGEVNAFYIALDLSEHIEEEDTDA